ncbi:MAG: hypothetical protein ACT4OZ_08020 [Gemmatimonadota bacterium]
MTGIASPESSTSDRRVEIRPYRDRDRGAIRRICCTTAFRNRGFSVLLADAELFADYWTSYYTDHEPESVLVAECGGEGDGAIVAYLTGCRDTARFRRVMTRRIVPRLLAGVAKRAMSERSQAGKARRFLGWMVTRGWREEPKVDLLAFPAHYHANVASRIPGQRLYSSMTLRFLDQLEGAGVHGIHGQVLDDENGTWSRMVEAFRAENPAVQLRSWEMESTIGRVLDGTTKPRGPESRLINRAFGATVPEFRQAIRFLARRFRI